MLVIPMISLNEIINNTITQTAIINQIINYLVTFRLICGFQIPREPHRATRLLQLTGRWQGDGIM